MGKPNQEVPEEPFHEIIRHCCPIAQNPERKQIHPHLCPTTRYPEAFPLRNLTVKTIVINSPNCSLPLAYLGRYKVTEALISREISLQQSKQNFELSRLSTAYHPQSQGALERCHQTLKALLSKFCPDQEWHWEQQHLQLREVLTRLQGAHLTVKLAKTIFNKATVTCLGHEVGQGRVRHPGVPCPYYSENSYF